MKTNQRGFNHYEHLCDDYANTDCCDVECICEDLCYAVQP